MDNSYKSVQHIPPYTEQAISRRPKKQVWDGVGVIAIGQNPEPIKSDYFMGVISGTPPLIIYEAKATSIEQKGQTLPILIGRVYMLFEGKRVILDEYGIHAPKQEQKLTADEISDLLESLKIFGEVNFQLTRFDYELGIEKDESGKPARVLVQKDDIVPVLSLIERMVRQHIG